MKIVDIHAHFFPDKIQTAIYDWFDNFGWKMYKRYSFEESVKHLKIRGIDKRVIAVYAHKRGVSAYFNNWLGNISKEYNNIVPFGTVHPEDSNIKEISEDIFNKHKLSGVKIHCHVEKVKPEDERLFPLYENIIKNDAVLLLHGTLYPSDASIRKDFNPADYSGAKHVYNLLKTYPEMKIIVAHLGMGEYDKFAELLDSFDNLYLDTAAVYCFNDEQKKTYDISPPPTRDFIKKYNKKILFGSDFPFIPNDISHQINVINNLDISKEEKENIFYLNAKKILNLDKV